MKMTISEIAKNFSGKTKIEITINKRNKVMFVIFSRNKPTDLTLTREIYFEPKDLIESKILTTLDVALKDISIAKFDTIKFT